MNENRLLYKTKNGDVIKEIVEDITLPKVILESGQEVLIDSNDIIVSTEKHERIKTIEEIFEKFGGIYLDTREYEKNRFLGKWRLPTLKELEQAREDDIYGFFGGDFWSSDIPSTQSVGFLTHAGVFGFEFEDNDGWWLKTEDFNIRLVRENERREHNLEWADSRFNIRGSWFDGLELANNKNEIFKI